jgi:hypothetical protein
MWVISMPARRLNSSPDRCGDVPVPDDANVILPLFFLACSTNSITDFAGDECGTTIRFG